MQKCWNCHNTIPDHARFCPNCGSPQLKQDTTVVTEELRQELWTTFGARLKEKVTELFGRKKYKTYLKRVGESGFDKTLPETLSTIYQQSLHLEPAAGRQFLQEKFDHLIDQFLVLHCKDINDYDLPPQILSYHTKNWQDINLRQMALDFLDFTHEPSLIVYTDFSNIPESTFKNITKSFLFAERQERVYLVVDISVFGSGKEGFAITDRGFYWKDFLGKAKMVPFFEVEEIKKTEDWLTINGHFFNVKPSINGKILLFLKTVKTMIR